MERISDRVFRWVEMHGESRCEPYPWNSFAIRIPEEGALVLVDPLPMSEEEAGELEAFGPPTHIVVTCEYHLRDSDRYRRRWGSRLLANEIERERYGIPLDGLYHDGDILLGKIRCVQVPGGYYPETALLVEGKPRVLLIGDILSGGRCDAGIPDGGLGIAFPEYVPELGSIRISLRRLIDLEFEVLAFGHGLPVRDDAKSKLREYTASEQVWTKLATTRAERGLRKAR